VSGVVFTIYFLYGDIVNYICLHTAYIRPTCGSFIVRMVEVRKRRANGNSGTKYFFDWVYGSYRFTIFCMIFQKEELLEVDESIIGRVRKHWIVYVSDVVLHGFGCLLFLGVVAVLSSSVATSTVGYAIIQNSKLIILFFVLLFWISFFFFWTKNYFDVWFLTNKRLIAVNQKEMFDREEVFMELSRIQDVFFEREGIIATLLNYGRLKVQSAGIDQEFVMTHVYDVENVAHTIMGLRDEAQGKNAAKI